MSLGGTCSFCTDTSLARATPIGTTSTVTPSGLAASTALMASPTFSLPSDMQHQALLAGLGKGRGGQADGGGQVGAFGADDGLDLLQVHRGVGRGFDAGLGAEDDDARPCPPSSSPWQIRLTYSRAASCCGEGTLSERSSTKKTFMPSTGRSHWRPAMASTRAVSDDERESPARSSAARG